MKKSLSFNAAMSAFKTLMNIIFPLITFPYASNVLQVENLGKVNFASSVCGYFLLFAGLGISSYAVREGSRYVNDREKLSAFASEMFSINMISTALTYAALAVTMLLLDKASCLYRPDAGAEFTNLLYDHRHRMGVHDL
ncbi:MAG: oligosaccharide flippase family protein [Faecalibacterium sp.]